jgi:methyl-accepting chemotaxis protein
MDVMLAYNGDQPATKAELRAETNAIRSDLYLFKTEVKEEFANVRADVNILRSELHGVRSELLTEIREVNHRLALGILKSHEQLSHQIQNLADTMEKRFSELMGTMDSFAKMAEAYNQKSFSHSDMLQNHESQLKNHEKRIGSLETKH